MAAGGVQQLEPPQSSAGPGDQRDPAGKGIASGIGASIPGRPGKESGSDPGRDDQPPPLGEVPFLALLSVPLLVLRVSFQLSAVRFPRDLNQTLNSCFIKSGFRLW